MHLPDLSATIVALSTPPGVGAIAVIRLSGSEAILITDCIFKGKKLQDQPSHTAHFGRLEDEHGHLVDEVLVTIFHGPKSYTGENTVEISCHGSAYIQQEIIQLCLRSGARMAQPGEFTLRAFLNGKMDLSQAEAVADLINSQSEAAHSIALRQLRGGFKNEISLLREELIHFASLVELELDFGEEDVEFADRQDLKNLVLKIKAHLHPLLQSFTLGNALKTGVATVIAGRPNAGKSTLLNALLNEERAIVSDIAGTTRDTIEEVLNIKGVQFRLIDTAGIREAQDQIEAIGVRKTMEQIERASILIYVWDVVSGMTLAEVHRDVRELLGEMEGVGGLREGDYEGGQPQGLGRMQDVGRPQGLGQPQGLPLLVVCNKMDKNPLFQTAWLADPTLPDIHPYLLEDVPLENSVFRIPHSAIIPVSAKNDQNIEYLKEKIFDTIAGGEVNLESTIVTNARHFGALRQADAALADVLHSLDSNVTGDFVAQDIRCALAFLGEITGQIGVEDLLGNIFGKFCIGK